MYRQHSGKQNSNIHKQSGLNIKKLIRNTLTIAAVVEVIVIPFLGFSLENFLLVFLISLLPVILAIFMISNFSGNSRNINKKTQITYQNKNIIHESEYIKHNNVKRGKGSKLVLLERKNFNWNIEEQGNNTNLKDKFVVSKKDMKKQGDIEEIKKRYNPYRSPFEPINPVHNDDIKDNEEFNEYALESKSTDTSDEYMSNCSDDINLDEGIDNLHLVNSEEFTAAVTEYEDTIDVDQDIIEFQDDDSNYNNEYDVTSQNNLHDDGKVVKLVFKQKNNENKLQIVQNPVIHNVVEKKDELPYIFPQIHLLKKQASVNNEAEFDSDIEYTANKLIETLSSFGVGARVLDVSKGPSVTRYELQPNAGVKVSKIVGLADDIALNLAATGVRIEAPIPGKAAVGIEVPNKEVTAVLLRDVIESKEFQSHPSKLAFAVGKDVAGRIVVGDIAKMPHLLIAGATGSGKSVCINTLIASILYKSSPKEVKLLMVDPKVVELGIYNGIPHLLIPVVTDPKKAAGALNWAVVEMTTRYKLFAENNSRDLKGYNALMMERGEEPLPQIVIIIDELADLMMVAANDVEDCICRLAQMARAAGMHLVIATQRPSVDVITGVIKANIPSRISFAVSSQIDSRTILDMAGAEKLLGRGDMLYNPIGEPKPIRLQGGFISDKEVEEIVSEIKSNFQADYDQDVLARINSQPEQQHDSNDDDDLLTQAIEMVFVNGQASASLIQRKFKVGYSRAARILDQMESWGVVGPAEGSKPRQLLITKQEWDELNS